MMKLSLTLKKLVQIISGKEAYPAKLAFNIGFKETNIGPSGVRALPLAAGINEGGHYFGPSVLCAPAEQLRWPLF